jgi:hypothetical protein
VAGRPGATADYILTQPAGCALNLRSLTTPVTEHYPVTCDVELDQVKIAVARAVRAETIRSRQTASVEPPQAAAAKLSTLNHPLLWLAVALGSLAALGTLVWVVASRRQPLATRTPALLTGGEEAQTSYTVVVGTRSATDAGTVQAPPRVAKPVIRLEASEGTHTQAEALRQRALAAEQRAERAQAMIRQGLLPDLSRWLKQKLVRKLVDDRAQLLETQQAAAHKVMAVEERLSRIEQQVQRQNDSYQARIEALTRELLTAKEENRELIRARIIQVKAEMEAARVRLMAQSDKDY